MSKISAYAILIMQVCMFGVLLSFSDTRIASDQWYIANTEVRPKLIELMDDRIHALMLSDEFFINSPCPMFEQNLRAASERHEAEYGADALSIRGVAFGIYIVEKFNRPAVVRGLEQLFGHLAVAVGMGPPNWTYGPFQIGLDAARDVRPELANDKEVFLAVANACTNSNIAIETIEKIVKHCEGAGVFTEQRIICVAELYNGNRFNQLGPDYSDGLMFAYRSAPTR